MERGWILAIDFGTTNTSAAVASGGRVDVVEIDGSARMPSAVFVDDHANLIVGAAAESHLPLAPARAERTPKRRIGDSVLVLGGEAVRPVDAIAAVLRAIASEAIRRQGGEAPAELRLTHPARWGAVRLSTLGEAARIAGLPDPVFVPEPVAAALYFADERVPAGSFVAVYDLGGGTFDTAVLRRTETGFEVAGPPGGDERLGGELFDEHLFLHLGERVAESDPAAWESLRFDTSRTWRKAAHDFRTEVRRAKEALSAQADYTIYLGAPVDMELLLTRDEVEQLIRPEIDATVRELLATIERAGLTPSDLAAVNIVGGSSRIPLVTRLVAEHVGRMPDTWGDPKAAVVLGAARAVAEDGRSVVIPASVAEDPTANADAPLDEPGIAPVLENTLEAPADDVPLVSPLVAAEDDAKRSLPVRALAIAAAVVVLLSAMLIAVTRGDADDGDRRADLASDGESTSTTGSRRSFSTTTTSIPIGALSADTTIAAGPSADSSGGSPADSQSSGAGVTTSTTSKPATGPGSTGGGGGGEGPTTTSTTTKEQAIAARSVPAGLTVEQQRIVRLIPDSTVRMSCRGGPGWNSDKPGYRDSAQCEVREGTFYLESYDTGTNADAAMASFNTLDSHEPQTAGGCSGSAFYYEGTYGSPDGGDPDGMLRCLLDGDISEIYWTDRSQRVLGWIWWYQPTYDELYGLWSSGDFGFDL